MEGQVNANQKPNTYKQDQTLQEECEVQQEAWIKYDEVVANVDSGHISCDLASTQI